MAETPPSCVFPAAPVNALAWLRPLSGYLWWPVFVYGLVDNMTPRVGKPSSSHPSGLCFVYVFGARQSATHPIRDLVPWEHPMRDAYSQGHPESAKDKPGIEQAFARAMLEVRAYDALPHPRRPPPRFSNVFATRPSMQLPKVPPRASFVVIALESLAWAKLTGFPWLPAFVLDPSRMTLRHAAWTAESDALGALLATAKANPYTHRLVYYFQSHNFGLHHDKSLPPTIKRWFCKDHATHMKGLPCRIKERKRRFKAQVATALDEVVDFKKAKQSVFDLPGMDAFKPATSSQTVVARAHEETVPSNALGWIQDEGHPWMPVFAYSLETVLAPRHVWDAMDVNEINVAKQSPDLYRLLHHFGSDRISLHPSHLVQPWQCPDAGFYLQGLVPQGTAFSSRDMGRFDNAMMAVEVGRSFARIASRG
ncbi:Aste57867_17972 [Aphanomyces stellatus]|uniref:Aste57867_17972 protein n=1 Tax=Aphanomyces stellatus TaxID=120398 RepID=A0A485LCI3_9STRA|nr:hypothetical protein As57867_017910 [Aphanomyces stellatus]VFT94712.1 Aste57867_17972 [Aphanomyces stellatus]